MKLSNLLPSLLLFFTVHITVGQDFNPEERLKELTSEGGNVGMTAGYSVDGEIKWTGSSGFVCEDDGEAFSTTTLTRIASISKNLTAVAVMQLVENGKMELDKPIGEYLSSLPDDKKEITVRQLLGHTSGISQYQGEREIENDINYPTLQDALEVFIDRKLLFEPGSGYFYTSYGYVVLGRVIEAASGMDYSKYMKSNIFDPAGMVNTGVEEMNASYPNKSCLYHKEKKKTKEGKQNDLSNRIPGGGFYSTLEDLLKFGNAVVDGTLISSKSLEAMLQSQPVEYDGNKYGLGWYFYGPPPNENLVIGHSGGQTGCTSQLMIIPKSKTVVVVLSNTSGTYPDIATFASELIGRSERGE